MTESEIFTSARNKLLEQGLTIVGEDLTRPWGGFFLISDAEIAVFLSHYFPDIVLPEWSKSLRMDPKILMVKPEKRLSWQYHNRRGEVWRVLEGSVGVMTSRTDIQPESPTIYKVGESIEIPQGTRHRLIGLDVWGVVAEIWVSTKKEHPTDEMDNIRLQDDYGRK